MRALFKTLFGSTRTLLAAAAALAAGFIALHSPMPALAGLIFPIALCAAAAYLARH